MHLLLDARSYRVSELKNQNCENKSIFCVFEKIPILVSDTLREIGFGFCAHSTYIFLYSSCLDQKSWEKLLLL